MVTIATRPLSEPAIPLPPVPVVRARSLPHRRCAAVDVNNGFTVAGVPTAAADPRQFQFGLKVNF